MRQFFNRFSSFLLALSLCLSMLSIEAQAAEPTSYFDPTGGEKAADAAPLEAGTTIWETGWYVATGEITISARVSVRGAVNLILADGAKLTLSAGVTVSGTNSLTVWGQSGQTGLLSATGTQYDAAIGGAKGQDGCNITINGGIIQATSATATISNAAGIGGGSDGDGYNITVNYGTVTAASGSSKSGYAAGIGGGQYGSGHDITINGGSVTAYGTSMKAASPLSYGAGIGGGNNGEGYNITINGGTVQASCAYNEYGKGAGIGGGNTGEGYQITINGGTVMAIAGNEGAGIGGGSSGDGHDIAIHGGDVTAKSGKETTTLATRVGAGIGGGARNSGYTITITDGTVHAYGGVNGGSGIGGSSTGGAHDIRIEGGVVTAEATAKKGSYPGIGGSTSGSVFNIRITGGTVTATGVGSAAGIGSGSTSSTVEKITISGGTVTATAGKDGGAGIGTAGGGGICANLKDITISGGTVIATGGPYSPGIGGGGNNSYSAPKYHGGAVENLVICGDSVILATGGKGAPGIGSGRTTAADTQQSTVTLRGGMITAIAGDTATPAIRAVLTFEDFPHQTYGNAEDLTPSDIIVESSDHLQEDWSPWHWVHIEPMVEQVKELALTPQVETTALNGRDAARVQFSAELGEENVTQSAEWSVRGQASKQTAIMDGLLTVGADESAESLTVTVRYADQEQTAAVTVVQPTLTVTFDSAGGTPYEPAEVTRYRPVSDPGVPQRTGYTFAGWYAEGSDQAWFFETPVTKSMTLTAHWVEIPVDSLTLSQNMLMLTEGAEAVITAEVLPASALHQTVTWTVDTAQAVTYTAERNTLRLIALNAGTATVTATAGQLSAVCIVTVEHMWNTPVFSWEKAADGYRATATRTCEKGHTESAEATVEKIVKTPAACEEKGVSLYIATVNFGGQSYQAEREEQDIAPLGHDFSTYISDDNATCTEDGTETAACTRCGQTDTRTVKGSATGHSYGQPEFVWTKDETWSAEARFTCRNGCGSVAAVPAAVESRTVTDSTCADAGTTAYTATVHFNGKDYTETKQVQDIPAKGHTPNDPVRENEIAATCTMEGSYDEVTYCSVCGTELTRVKKAIQMIPHTPGEEAKENENAATCTAEGSYDEVVYCSVCHEELSRETKTVEKLPHTPDKTAVEHKVAATCTESGSFEEVIYCIACHTELSRSTKVIAALGHRWDAGKVTRAPSEIHQGIRTFTCTRCGETRTESIAKVVCGFGDDCPSRRLHDVPKDWAHPGIDYAVRNGLMNGMENSLFQPETLMTRGMLVTVLWRYAGSPEGGRNAFIDVEPGRYYTKAVAWAAQNGVVNGVGENRFDPEGNVTREQMVAILYRYAEKLGRGTSKRDGLKAFQDAGDVSSFARDAVRWAVAEGILNGSDGNLLPQDNATRAQVAAIMMRYIENILE